MKNFNCSKLWSICDVGNISKLFVIYLFNDDNFIHLYKQVIKSKKTYVPIIILHLSNFILCYNKLNHIIHTIPSLRTGAAAPMRSSSRWSIWSSPSSTRPPLRSSIWRCARNGWAATWCCRCRSPACSTRRRCAMRCRSGSPTSKVPCPGGWAETPD